ncbi:hypothetical protein [uncultured Paludibaculum sp.]|uniref:hypothetical protein n=1 Tax=uncultured Paludibaculum sp. TaxID=1765020 RepID=UPI002AABA0B4|nr:hypothetical protein [uncultured Paludibaculum sp.]
MRIIVGGLGRKTGKTTLVCRIIALSPERAWTAVKISHHAPLEGTAYTLQSDASEGDTKRFLASGAARAYWLRGDLIAALPELRAVLAQSSNWIVESGQAIRHLEHDFALLAVDPANIDDEKVLGLLDRGEVDG